MGLTRRQMLRMAAASAVVPGGIFEQMVFQPSTGEVFDHHVQDVEPILLNNKRLNRDAEEGNGGYSDTREWRRIASIPLILVEKWLREEGINAMLREHWPYVAAKLDSPEYAFLRTAPGRVSRRPLRSYPSTHSRSAQQRSGSQRIVIARG